MPAPRDSESGVPLQIYAMIKLLSSSSSSSSPCLTFPNEIERVGLRQFAHTHTTNGHFGEKSSENYQYWDLKAQPEPVLFQSHERALGLSQ